MHWSKQTKRQSDTIQNDHSHDRTRSYNIKKLKVVECLKASCVICERTSKANKKCASSPLARVLKRHSRFAVIIIIVSVFFAVIVCVPEDGFESTFPFCIGFWTTCWICIERKQKQTHTRKRIIGINYARETCESCAARKPMHHCCESNVIR